MRSVHGSQGRPGPTTLTGKRPATHLRVARILQRSWQTGGWQDAVVLQKQSMLPVRVHRDTADMPGRLLVQIVVG